ncbi:MAG: LOG family protein, partial [Nitrososphaeria archaeon]
IKTGMEYRARSVPLVRSADALVALGGGAGTIIEVIMAYSMGKPVYILHNSGMSSDKLRLAFPEYIDDRKNSKIFYCKSGKELAEAVCGSTGKSEVTDFG